MNKISILVTVTLVLFKNCLVESLQCYGCQSNEDSGCAIAGVEHVSEWHHETCDSDVQECAAWINKNDTVTYRGCKPKFETHKISTCETNFCNYELFPKDRLSCYQCEECDNINLNDSKEICLNYEDDDQCYTIVLGGEKTGTHVGTTYRGCISDHDTIGMEYCTNQEFSRFCIKGDTNDQKSSDNSFECVTCNVTSTNCYETTNTASCGHLLLGREQDKCYTIKTSESIQRGCLRSYPTPLQCDAARDDCHVCSTIGCNSKKYRGIECHKCDSRIDVNCEGEKSRKGHCVSEDDDELLACVLQEKFFNGTKHVTRGCLHTIANAEVKESCVNGTDTCKICTSDICNKKPSFQHCIKCDSSVDENCATLINSELLPSELCEDYLAFCYSKIGGISEDGTERGCFSGDDYDPTDPYFRKCDSDNCNLHVIPANRIRCFQCDENTNKNCPITENKYPPLRYCAKYNTSQTEECYTMLDKESKRITRGCVIDSNFDLDVCEKNICKICKSDGCNRDQKHSNPNLFCIKCDATNDRNNSCLWGHDLVTAELCESPVEFGTLESCFTSVDKDGVVKRGCLNDNNQNDCLDNSCKKCQTTGCNRENIIKQSCVICNSTADATCENDNPNIEAKECPSEIQTFDERWCYTYRDIRDLSVHRGCLSDLSNDIKTTCLEGKKNICEICDTEGCNDKVPPNSSPKQIPSFLLVITFVMFITL